MTARRRVVAALVAAGITGAAGAAVRSAGPHAMFDPSGRLDPSQVIDGRVGPSTRLSIVGGEDDCTGPTGATTQVYRDQAGRLVCEVTTWPR